MIDDDPGLPPARSAAELAELAALRAEQRGLTAHHLRTADALQALTDGFRASWTGARDSDHPGARRYAGEPLSLASFARELLAASGRRVPDGGDGYGAAIAALSTSDFGETITGTVRGLVEAVPNPGLDDIQAITRDLLVPDFKPSSYTAIGLENLPIPNARTLDEFVYPRARLATEPYRAYSAAAKLLITREAIVGDTRGFLTAITEAFATAATGNEIAALVALLNANANLADGSAWFTGANTLASGIDATGLGNVAQALREYPRPDGGYSNQSLAALVVCPSDELSAVKLATEIYGPGRGPRVVALPGLSAGYFYAIGARSPIGRVRLRGSTPAAISIGGVTPAVEYERQTAQYRELNGLHLEVSHSVGLVPLARHGIVRGEL